MANEQTINQESGTRIGKLRFTFVIAALSLILMIVAFIHSAWTANNAREANLPVPAMELLARDLRTFHHQTGRFPHDFRELNERIWQGARAQQISPDGKTLTAAQANYFYTLHIINPPNPTRANTVVPPPKAAIWGVPMGERADESATYFWYVTPQTIEGWMGPALRPETIGAISSVPSEQQLALLTMTRQTTSGTSLTAPKSSGVFSFFPF
ncbi:MAG: hypothetical protein ACR2G4_00825 [Pyrinomonadaceae bacterium]